MPDFSRVRVSRSEAMRLLCIEDDRVFRNVVDAHPELRHKLPGEKRHKYLTAVIAELLKGEKGSSDSRCAAGLGRTKST